MRRMFFELRYGPRIWIIYYKFYLSVTILLEDLRIVVIRVFCEEYFEWKLYKYLSIRIKFLLFYNIFIVI